MTAKSKTRKPKKLQKPRTITLPGKDFQPNKADMAQEYDMPEVSLRKIRNAFFRPLNIRRDDSK